MTGPSWVARTDDSGVGCYVHIPFCDRICPYCDFAVAEYRKSWVERYMRALPREIDLVTGRGPLQTLYFGGGTPSALPLGKLQRLLAVIFERFKTEPDSIECTLEANPARNEQDLSGWRRAGINRLSLGVQSFDDADLHRLGRTHTGEQAVQFCIAARAAGFSNISLDLIAGAPGQSLATFERNLNAAIDLKVDHVSVYGLTVETGTPYARWHEREPQAFPDDDALAEMLDSAHGILEDAGFLHYEISNFARPGFESAHNTGYWRQRDCLAFGVSAAGYEAGTRYRNDKDVARYCEAWERGASARVEEERLDPAARIGEAAMLSLRTSAGISYDDFMARFGIWAGDAFAEALKKCMAAGLLEQDGRGARLTRRGLLLANSVCAEFLAPQRSPVVMR